MILPSRLILPSLCTLAAWRLIPGKPICSDQFGVTGVISGKFSVRGIATKSLLVTMDNYI